MAVIINGSNTPTAGSVTYGDGSTYANNASGTAGQVLTSAGAGVPVWVDQSTLSAGSATTATSATSATTATTATNLAGGSAGTVPYQSASGTTAMLAAGTSGQVLKSNGASAPSWVTPSAGALVFVSSATASSSATIDFTGLSSTYAVYVVEMVSVVPATGSYLLMRTSSNNGSSYDTTGYLYSHLGTVSTNAGVNVDSSFGSIGHISVTNNQSTISTTASNSGQSGLVYIIDPAASNYTQILISETHFTNATTVAQSHGSGVRSSTSPVNAVRFYMDSGNIASGTFRLYGIANS